MRAQVGLKSYEHSLNARKTVKKYLTDKRSSWIQINLIIHNGFQGLKCSNITLFLKVFLKVMPLKQGKGFNTNHVIEACSLNWPSNIQRSCRSFSTVSYPRLYLQCFYDEDRVPSPVRLTSIIVNLILFRELLFLRTFGNFFALTRPVNSPRCLHE